MKILIASAGNVPFVGGSFTYMSQLKKGLEEEGHEVDIFGQSPSSEVYYLLNKNVSVNKGLIYLNIENKIIPEINKQFPNVHPWITDFETYSYTLEAALAYFDLESYDIIHAQDVVVARALGRVKSGKTPLVSTIHGLFSKEILLHLTTSGTLTEEQRSDVTKYVQNIEYLGCLSSDLVITPSNWLKNEMMSHFPDFSNQMIVSPYGMNIEKFKTEMEKPLQFIEDTNKTIIICTARLDPIKGHENLLNALAQLKNSNQDWICWLVGDGELKNNLKRLTASLRLNDHVQFLGNRDDVPALLKRADIFVLSSIQENHPFALMEAQVANKAVVVSDAGGMPEMVTHLQTGLLFPIGNREELSERLRSILLNTELRNRLAKNGNEWAETRFSHVKMVERVLKFYEKVLLVD
ncbi:glycosyltransferase family 4 protein [Metabacillus fastidiosus]|uniref:glycosyltransferase family 4 protein n=1 Tax=Metabacillus fastidiosus TaxID=1458 RepID=UPI002E1CAA9F|nr:glycosyltransferase family 4 protein [Metabacillus fastidiosus]